MAESEEEDKEMVEQIEGTQKKLIEAEKEDNQALKRTVTKLKDEIDKVETGPKSRERKRDKDQIDLPKFDLAVEQADVNELKRMIMEA